MELFYTNMAKEPCKGDIINLNSAEGTHCINVLRHKSGDEINVIDGKGNLLVCEILDIGDLSLPCKKGKGKKCANIEIPLKILQVLPNFGSHPYNLTMAVAPTKNMDRFEWFVEKGTEIGLDVVVPVIGEHSERKNINEERLEKILVSASKQSLKGLVPTLENVISVNDFCVNCNADIKLICYCGKEVERKYISTLLSDKVISNLDSSSSIAILIGPEGDFSPYEVEIALKNGFTAVHLGSSRLRTETAAVVAVSLVSSHFEEENNNQN